MAHRRILIVEDELLVARDLQTRLKRMKYDVPEIAASAVEGLDLAGTLKPDLVLTDIRLGSGPDGIDLAQLIRTEYEIPVIFITAFTDDETLARAKLTEPYGYVIKPFNDRELQIAIEIAVFKHRLEHELKENRSWLSAILQSIGDSVIATDQNGRIVFINPAAENLTGWSEEDARGLDLGVVYNVLDRKKFFTPWFKFSGRENLKTDSFNQSILISKNGKEHPIQAKISVLKNDKGSEIGEVAVFRDISVHEASLLPVLA